MLPTQMCTRILPHTRATLGATVTSAVRHPHVTCQSVEHMMGPCRRQRQERQERADVPTAPLDHDQYDLLMTHDPAYFALLQQFLRESHPQRKFAAYEQIATATLAPISTLWTGEPTVLWNDLVPATWATLEQGLTFWEALLRNDTTDAVQHHGRHRTSAASNW